MSVLVWSTGLWGCGDNQPFLNADGATYDAVAVHSDAGALERRGPRGRQGGSNWRGGGSGGVGSGGIAVSGGRGGGGGLSTHSGGSGNGGTGGRGVGASAGGSIGTGSGGVAASGSGGTPGSGGATGGATGATGGAVGATGGATGGAMEHMPPASGGQHGSGTGGAGTGGTSGTGGATVSTGGGAGMVSHADGGAGASGHTGGAAMGGGGAAGAGGQGGNVVDPCPTDSDQDGVNDCLDRCPSDPTRSQSPCGAGPAHCDLTWMTVSNVYAQIGSLDVLIDGYVTRIPKSNFHGGGGELQNTDSPSLPDVTTASQVLAALGGSSKINLLLTGHSHFDHSFDTGTWSFLTGAPIIGSRTTCFQTVAQGIPSRRCTEVLGGEKILLAPGVTLRVVRWNHSGDSTSNPEQHNPVELSAVPITDPVTGGLHAGVGEDFPNGGGGRAFLFTIDGADGPYSWFFLDSAGYADLDVPIVVDGIDYGAPLANLKAAMADAHLSGVDLWVGAGGDPVARLVLPVLKPKAYLPVHWDNFFAPLRSRPGPYSDRALATTLGGQGVNLVTPVQAMDKWRLDRKGVQPMANTAIKDALNIQ